MISLYGVPGFQWWRYGCGRCDSASGMKPICASGFMPRSMYVSKMRSTMVQS